MALYIDRLKCKNFEWNMDEHFQTAQGINVDIINHCCRGDHLQNFEEFYRTIEKSNFKEFPKLEKKKALSDANRTSRSDLWIQRGLIIEHLRTLSFH